MLKVKVTPSASVQGGTVALRKSGKPVAVAKVDHGRVRFVLGKLSPRWYAYKVVFRATKTAIRAERLVVVRVR